MNRKQTIKLSETTLPIGNSYIRVVSKSIQAFPGMGVTRLMFTFEFSNKDQGSTGYPMWLNGQVEAHARDGNRCYVGQLQPGTPQPINIVQFGREATTQVTLDLTNHQFWLIDENRTSGAVRLFLTFTGHAFIDGQYVPVQGSPPLNIQINQSDWIDTIRQAGLKRVLLLELEAPDPLTHPELSESLDYYAKAQARYGEGEWRLTVESVRQALAALVGKKAEDEDQESDIESAIRSASREAHSTTGSDYQKRRELVRRATKFMADLGAHPEACETRKNDAYAALMIAGGLLHAFTRAAGS
jgi:hypothetical protein